MICTLFGLSLVVVAAGGAGPTGKVKPDMHLKNAQTVKVSGQGFSPNETIYIVECNKTARKTGEAACDLSNFATASSNAKGRVPATNFTVQTGPIGNGTCGTAKRYAKCYVVLGNASLTELAPVPVLFSVP